jgi:hypothetical protein
MLSPLVQMSEGGVTVAGTVPKFMSASRVPKFNTELPVTEHAFITVPLAVTVAAIEPAAAPVQLIVTVIVPLVSVSAYAF